MCGCGWVGGFEGTVRVCMCGCGWVGVKGQ